MRGEDGEVEGVGHEVVAAVAGMEVVWGVGLGAEAVRVGRVARDGLPLLGAKPTRSPSARHFENQLQVREQRLPA